MKIKDIFDADNIKSYIEGNGKYFYDNLIGLPQHQKEQIAYRLEMCKNDCVPNGTCKNCTCPTKKKVFATKSCNNGERFPDIMSKEKWEEFKIKNGITS